MSILSGLSTCSGTASFYTSVGWRLMQTAPFGVLMPSPVFHPCSLTDRASVSYTDCVGSIPTGGTFQPYCGCRFFEALPGSGLVYRLTGLGEGFSCILVLCGCSSFVLQAMR